MNTQDFQRALAWLLAGLLLFLLYSIVQPFLVSLTWAAILAIFFFPLHRLVGRVIPGANLAALASTAVVTVLLVLPVLLVTPVVAQEAVAFFDWVRSKDGIAQAKTLLDRYLSSVPVTFGDVQSTLEDLARKAGALVAQQSARLAGNVAGFFFHLVVMLLALFYLFREGPALVHWIADLSPLGGTGHSRVIHETAELVQVTITSSFIVAAVQGSLGGLTFWVLGIPSAAIYALLMALLAFLPLVGPWLIWVPMAVTLIVTGSRGRGIALIILGFLVVSGVDNVLRPLLIAGRSQLNGLLVFISVLGGMQAFGFVGVVLGPLIVTIAVGLLKAYRAELRERAAGVVTPLLVLALLPAAAWGAETPLPIPGEGWTPRYFNIGTVPPAEAAGFAMVDDPERGGSLAVGPWRAGDFSIRYEYSRRLPLVEGRLRGNYRTEELLPNQAFVTIHFYRGGTRTGTADFRLAPAREWTGFEVPIRRAPRTTDSMVIGVGLSGKSEGRALFSGLEVSDDPFETAFPPEPPELTRAAPPGDFEPGPRYRLAERDGAWWLVSPEGKAFYSLAVDPPAFELNPAGIERGRELVAQLCGLGFNSLAGWHNLWRYTPLNDLLAAEGAEPVPQFQVANVIAGADLLVDAAGKDTGDHSFPDPFDPRWEAGLRASLQDRLRQMRGRPFFVAWFAGNERTHHDLHRRVWSRHCSAALRKFLEQRYESDVARLNQAWGTEFSSFEDLVRARPDPLLRRGAMYEDFRAFKRELLRCFNETLLRVIREEDPGRLVFSHRFMTGEVGDWVEELDLYEGFDGIAVNLYPSNLSAGLNANELALLRLVHERTGKPVLLSEWSIPAIDSGLYDDPNKLDWSYPQTVNTQQERARQAACVTAEFFNLPFLVGSHWFIWNDYDSPERYANRGLFKKNGDPWPELQEALRRIHGRIAAHR